MHLLLYDIEAKKDPHGIRIRLVRALRKSGAYQLHRSAWVINELSDALIGVIKEYRNAGGSVKITEWLPRMIGEVSPAKVSLLKVTIAVNGGDPVMEGAHVALSKALEGMGFTVDVRPIGMSASIALSKEFGTRASLVQSCNSISRMLDEAVLCDLDALIMLNSGRSVQSGIVFGAQTISNTRILKNMVSLPLMQVERLGKPDAAVIVWSDAARGLARRIANDLKISMITPNLETKAITVQGRKEIRQVHYANIGDAIIMDGRRIGACLTDQVYIVVEDGRLVDIIGGKMSRREAKKVRVASLSSAIVKTVSLADNKKEKGKEK